MKRGHAVLGCFSAGRRGSSVWAEYAMKLLMRMVNVDFRP